MRATAHAALSSGVLPGAPGSGFPTVGALSSSVVSLVVVLLAGAAVFMAAVAARVLVEMRRARGQGSAAPGQGPGPPGSPVEIESGVGTGPTGTLLTEVLTRLDRRIDALAQSQAGREASLAEQIRTLAAGSEGLRRETARLAGALHHPGARGRWGELQLRRAVELAGMVPYCDFTEQVSVRGEEGALRPDLVVHLPGARDVVVDAKAPLEAHVDALEATDRAELVRLRRRHAQAVRHHIDRLASKEYWRQFATAPDFVAMFVPGDAILGAALEYDETLYEYGAQRRVLLVTPVTLIGLLHAVAFGWQQAALADNARRIAELGKEMQDRLAGFVGHLDKSGQELERAVCAHNRAVASLESRVLVTARRFAELDVPGRAIPEVSRVDESVRPVSVRPLGAGPPVR